MNTKTKTIKTIAEDQERVALLQTSEDMKTAMLFVSLLVNVTIFIAWLVIEVDPNVALILMRTN